MITFRTIAEVSEDHRVVLNVPPQAPTGKAKFTVTVAPVEPEVVGKGELRRHFGAIHSGNARAADNEAIDSDLAKAYGNPEQ